MVNSLAAICSIKVVKHVGRVKLLVWGHTLMGVAHLIIGVAALGGQDNLVLVALMSFLIFYENTSNPVTWLYLTETCIDASIGFSMMTLWVSLFFLSLRFA